VSKCVICWNQKNPDEFATEVSADYILKEFVVCKKHREELKKEIPMSVLCSGCGKPTTPRTVPKGPRGPWVANECLNGCMNGQYKLTTKAPRTNQYVPEGQTGVVSANPNSNLEKKIDTILAILKENFPPLAVKEELVSEEDSSPF